MRNKYMLIGLVGVVAGVLFSSAVMVLAGSTDSPSAPEDTYSHTLEHIYDRLDTGAATAAITFTEPITGPEGTMHTLDEIMGKAPAVDDTNGAGVADVASGKKFWGLTSGAWGLQTGTAAAGSNVNGAEGSKTFNIPDGLYSGSKTCTANDTQLVAGNIKSGVNIFGVDGELEGSCTCSGTLNGTRWCDNGDGTVTDLLGYDGKGQCLVWLKDANCIGTKEWADDSDWDDAQTASGILEDGDCSLSDGSVEGDWRLPTKSELVAITDSSGTDYVRSDTPRAFTGVQSDYYWSSTTYAFYTSYAWDVSLVSGGADDDAKTGNYYVWPVRGGQ